VVSADQNNLHVALFAKKETLVSDGVYESGFSPITHYFPGTDAYEGTNGYPSLSPHIIQAMDLINNQKYLAQLTENGEFKEHVVATLTEAKIKPLLLNNFGMSLQVGNYYTVIFGTTVVLPKGWGSAVDPLSGKTYYYNKDTGVTTWTYPADQIKIDGHTKKEIACKELEVSLGIACLAGGPESLGVVCAVAGMAGGITLWLN